MSKDKRSLKEIIKNEAFFIKDMQQLEMVTTLPFMQYDENNPFFDNVSKEVYYSYLDSMRADCLRSSACHRYSSEHNRTIFSLYALNENEDIKRLLNEDYNADKLLYVKDGRIWPYFSVKLFISERTESIEMFVPNRRDDPFFANKSNYELLKWALENLPFVPVMVREEEFENDKVSHKWSHIRKQGEVMSNLRPYIRETDFKPGYNIYYFICKRRNKKGKVMWYLKRDTSVNPKYKPKE